MTAFTSSSPTLTLLSIFARCRRCDAISPSIWRRSDLIDEPFESRKAASWSGVCFTFAATRMTVLSMSAGLIVIFSRPASWICSVSSIRLRSTCWRRRSISVVGIWPPLAIASSASR